MPRPKCAESEVLSKACTAKRSALHALVESRRSWAVAQSPLIILPGDDDAVRMPGFTTASEKEALHYTSGYDREDSTAGVVVKFPARA
jgi:hypothetical protein